MTANNAVAYAQSVCSHLELLDEVQADWMGTAIRPQTTRDALEALSEARKEDAADLHLVDLYNALYDLVGEDEGRLRSEDLGMLIVEDSLEWWVDLRWGQNTRRTEVRTATILVTAGGPHCEVRLADTREDVVVSVWWGGEEVERTIQCRPLAWALELLCESAKELQSA